MKAFALSKIAGASCLLLLLVPALASAATLDDVINNHRLIMFYTNVQNGLLLVLIFAVVAFRK